MKEIQLINGGVTLVSDEDYEYLMNWKWRRIDSTSTSYVVRRGANTHRVHMHRVIMKPPSDMVVDHINGNGLDNRRENLRVCTTRENVQNKRMPVHNTVGYKGVTRHHSGKYQAQITVNGKHKNLGIYSDPLEAAHVYDNAAIKYFGEFARINFPSEQ